MRTETQDLTEGFGTVRWEDSEDTLCRLHPGARWLDGYEGHNPVTREQVSVPPMLHVPGFIRLGEDMVLDASFELGPRGLRALRLTPSESEDAVDPAECLARLARMWQLEVQEGGEAQAWVVQGAHVGFERDGAWFTLVIRSPRE